MITTPQKKKIRVLPLFLTTILILVTCFTLYVNLYKPRKILEYGSRLLDSFGIAGDSEALTGTERDRGAISEEARKKDAEVCAKLRQREYLVVLDTITKLGSTVGIYNITCDDETASLVGQLSYLNCLNMDNVQITPAQCETMFRNLTRITSLNLNKCSITSEMMRNFVHMKKLVGITLSDTQIDKKGLEMILDLPKLRILTLSNTRIGNEDLDVVSRFHQIHWLLLENTQVNDEGLIKLASMKNLKHLTIRKGNNISQKAIDELVAANPRITAID